MTAAAGLFLTAFGGLGAWFLSRHYPGARFLRAGYVLMAAGGALFVAWTLSKLLPVGVAGAVVMTAGAIAGIAGALRKELRPTR